MNKLQHLLLALALTMGAATTAQAQDNATTGLAMAPAAQADTAAVPAAKMSRDITCVVITPEQYQAGSERYPVLYLLHGASGSYRDWPTKANLDKLASQYGIIIVCPDGQDSWYLDSPIDSKFQYETFISQELVAWVDANYRTMATRDKRAITGLSMGGHGALFNAFRHADVFGACGSMSGGVDIAQFPNRWNINKRLGQFGSNIEVWESHAVVNQLSRIKPGELAIIIDDGTDDFFLEVNERLHEELLKAGIAHDFILRPGGHSWTYWINSLDYQMLFFAKFFAK